MARMKMVQKNLGKQISACLGLLVWAELCSVTTGRTTHAQSWSRGQGGAQKDPGRVKVLSPLRLSPNPHVAFPLLGSCPSSSPGHSYFPLSLWENRNNSEWCGTKDVGSADIHLRPWLAYLLVFKWSWSIKWGHFAGLWKGLEEALYMQVYTLIYLISVNVIGTLR